jgi:hypothetical protein
MGPFNRLVDGFSQSEIIGCEYDPSQAVQLQLKQEDRHPHQHQDGDNHRSQREMGEAVPKALPVSEKGFWRLDPHRRMDDVTVLRHAAPGSNNSVPVFLWQPRQNGQASAY